MSLDEIVARQRAEIAEDMRMTTSELLDEMFERMRIIMHDRYGDLANRLAKLERAVFPPPRARRKRAG